MLEDFGEIRREFVSHLTESQVQNVLATAVGPKIVDGTFTESFSIQVIVKRKMPKATLASGFELPSSFDGFDTDVIDGNGELSIRTETSIPANAVPLGYGSGVWNSRHRFGTVGFAVTDEVGEEALVSAAHFLQMDEAVRSAEYTSGPIGTVTRRCTSLLGREMYGEMARYPEERFSVDSSLIKLLPGTITRSGLPGGFDFELPADNLSLLDWLLRKEVFAYGHGSRSWRIGVVSGLFPRRIKGRVTGFCYVEHHPSSKGGDSGSLWLSKRAGRYIGIGTHWGLVKNFAFLNDVSAVLRALEIGHYLGSGDH